MKPQWPPQRQEAEHDTEEKEHVRREEIKQGEVLLKESDAT